MKVLILGGTKFFGKEFAVDLAKQNHQVTVFSKRCPVVDLPDEIQQINGNRNSREDLLNLAEQEWDFVLDNICFDEKQAQLAVDIFRKKIKHWIFISTGDVHLILKNSKSPYDEKQTKTLEEDKKIIEENLEPYGQGKRQAEKVLEKAYKDFGFPYTIVRFPIVIGPQDPKIRAYTYWLRILNGDTIILPDGGKYNRRYISVWDCARALNLILDNFETTVGETFHIGDDKTLTLKEFIELSSTILKKPAKTIDIPHKWLKKNKYDFAKFSPYYNHGDYVLDIDKAKRALSWKSLDIQEWMKKTMDWYLENNIEYPSSYNEAKQEKILIKKWENK